MQKKQISILKQPFIGPYVLLFVVCYFFYSCGPASKTADHMDDTTPVQLKLVKDDGEETISVFRVGVDTPVLVQHAKTDFRPYIHPLVAPDGDGVLTEYSPGHHKH